MNFEIKDAPALTKKTRKSLLFLLILLLTCNLHLEVYKVSILPTLDIRSYP